MLRVLIFLLSVFVIACQSFSPKPLAYNRIDIPVTVKRDLVVSGCSWQSKLYNGAKVEKNDRNECWSTLVFPRYNAEVFLSYFEIGDNPNLADLLDQMHNLSLDHQQMANGIDVQSATLPSGNFILEYNISGNAATNYQFCITDSTEHFLRGALYFRNKPNFDSTLPALNFMKQEVKVFMDSLQWRR